MLNQICQEINHSGPLEALERSILSAMEWPNQLCGSFDIATSFSQTAYHIDPTWVLSIYSFEIVFRTVLYMINASYL